MSIASRRVRTVAFMILSVASCATLDLSFPGTVIAGPRLGAELVVQHVREDTDGLLDPKAFPVSGGGTFTLRWKATPRIDLVTGLGYEERATLGRPQLSVFGPTAASDIQGQWRSLVFPLHARIPIGRFLRFEAGPEWRWLLQARNRFPIESSSFASVAGPRRAQSEIFEEASVGQWFDVTSSYHRSTFALSAGLGLHRGWLGGDVGMGLRWCESLGDQLESEYSRSHFREFQLALSWER
jgi:hypothetical protein